MTFFKKYNGTMDKRLARLETLIWLLIYGGCILGLVGLFMQRGGDEGQWMMVAGIAAVAAGVALVVLRARVKEAPDPAPTAPPVRPPR